MSQSLFSQAEGEQLVFFIGPTVVILCQLFLYCYYGQRVTDQVGTFNRLNCYLNTLTIFQSNQLAESVYQLKWYNYPIQLQRYLQLIMLRSQNSSYFSGFGFVYCSLESFADVIDEHFLAIIDNQQNVCLQILKFVGSVVALFKNLQE